MQRILLGFLAVLLFSTKIFGQCESSNAAQGLPPTAAFGSVSISNYDPKRAFDVNDSSNVTYWSDNGGNAVQEIGIDFGQLLDFCSVDMKWGVNEYPSHFYIQGTTGFADPWVTLKEITGNTSNVLTGIELNQLGLFRILRILPVARPSGATVYTLYDCKIHTRIANILPSATLTSPVNGASYLLGNNVEITANASDADGIVKKVEFYKDATKLGTDSIAPYNFTWTTTDTGRFSIFVKVTDSIGGYKRSDTAVIRVTNAPAALRSWNLTGTTIYNSNSGVVAIGRIPANFPADTSLKLSVNGSIYAKKLKVTQIGWADYVFAPSYKLLPLKEVESFIRKNRHLPGVISAATVAKNGVDLGENQAVLLKKLEELTLYIIQLNKEIEQLKKAKLK